MDQQAQLADVAAKLRATELAFASAEALSECRVRDALRLGVESLRAIRTAAGEQVTRRSLDVHPRVHACADWAAGHVALSPDAAWLAVCDREAVRRSDAATLTEIFRFEQRTSARNHAAAAFSGDGTMLASAALSGDLARIRVSDLAGGMLRAEFEVHGTDPHRRRRDPEVW